MLLRQVLQSRRWHLSGPRLLQLTHFLQSGASSSPLLLVWTIVLFRMLGSTAEDQLDASS
jgi:hypothetical protein